MELLTAFLASIPMLIIGLSWMTALYSVRVEAKGRKISHYDHFDLIWLYAYVAIGLMYSGVVAGLYNTSIEHMALISIGVLLLVAYLYDKPLDRFYAVEGISLRERSGNPLAGNLLHMLRGTEGWIVLVLVVVVSFCSVGLYFLLNI